MNRIHLFRSATVALAFCAAAATSPAFAQTEIVQATNPDADSLADQIRALATNPRDIHALLAAGEIDVALLYDDFSSAVLMQLEDYGFCQPGEGADYFVADLVPVNTHGGNITEAFAWGETHLVEAVKQLRGTATNQVSGASTALVTGDPGSLPLSAVILRKA